MEEGKENDKSSWIKKEYGTALISLGSLAVQYLLPP